MEYLSSSAFGFVSRSQMEYRQLNDNISKLIDDLGDKMQKDLITLEQKILLQFKTNLIQAQQNYRHLQKERNDQVIKENILNLKNQQEKIFSTQEEKSLQMNKLYDRLKLDLKRSVEYEHELELEGKYLARQCIIAKQKGEILDEQIKQYQTNSSKPKKHTFQDKINCLPKIFKSRVSESPKTKFVPQDLRQKRLKTKKQSIKEFIDYISDEQTTLEKIVQYYDIDDCASQKQKLNLVEVILNDKEFKKYIYKMLFKPGASSESLK